MGKCKMMIGIGIGSYWNHELNKEDIEERKLYLKIVKILLKNKEEIEYVSSKVIKDTRYYYFKYKDKEIDICKYDWKESTDKYNLTIDNVWFIGSNSFSFKYLDLCEYLYKLGEKKYFDEIIKKSKEESTKMHNERIQKLKNVLKNLNK